MTPEMKLVILVALNCPRRRLANGAVADVPFVSPLASYDEIHLSIYMYIHVYIYIYSLPRFLEVDKSVT